MPHQKDEDSLVQEAEEASWNHEENQKSNRAARTAIENDIVDSRGTKEALPIKDDLTSASTKYVVKALCASLKKTKQFSR